MIGFIVGCAMAIMGGAALALSMVTQRYALSPSFGDEHTVNMFGCNMPRNVAWFLGLCGYGIANGFYAVAMNLGPLAVMASCFTTLLVFNMIFARLLLGEPLTRMKVLGGMTILVGVILCVVGAAQDAPVDFTPAEVEALLKRAAGAIYFAVLIFMVFASIAAICMYESAYPQAPAEEEQPAAEGGPMDMAAEGAPMDMAVEGEASASGEAAPATEEGTDVDEDARDRSSSMPTMAEVTRSHTVRIKPGELSGAPQNVAPKWLDMVMALVYPGSLGLDEGICHLAMKAGTAMIATCGDSDSCGSPTVIIMCTIWIVTALATVWWLRVVFARYETTIALPIEYGTVNACSVCSGLIFYGEQEYMEGWQLALNVAGLLIILVGIGVGSLGASDSESSKVQPEEPEPANMKAPQQLTTPALALQKEGAHKELGWP